jgi:hypothetical protein
MGQMVTYRYYIGRLNMFEDQHGLAEQNLDYALKHCHRNAVRNKKRILRYLVPVKLYRGRLPTPYCTFVNLWMFGRLSMLLFPILTMTALLFQCSKSMDSTSSSLWWKVFERVIYGRFKMVS